MPQPEITLQLAPKHLAALRALLAQHVPQAEVWAYGSRVSGGAHEGSDLDLVVRDTAQTAASGAALVPLAEALQASGLPMLVEVHDWSHLPTAFRASIEHRHVVVKAATSSVG